MKNELGIEVKCDNCWLKYDCNLPVENACRKDGEHLYFLPSIEASSNRIKELQEQLEISENAYHKTLDAYHDVAEKLEELKARSRK